ncbi:arginase family protein [Stenotrophomonas sp. S41]|uniref:arginase family protein n=1 Tax=Stenotrophomonas sp. S41 TaxID=2767464 RepID=UPI00190B5C25|nr:arginase family protein [Stenotrophomonas sp. S41]MBK0011701.1 arginase family protein [Stenotrophomonas sp. S41]
MATATTTLRLLFPQWQGGNHPAYSIGARLLAWLAPESSAPLETVSVDSYRTDLPVQDGIFARDALRKQADRAKLILDAHSPDRVVVFGGDCLVDLMPFSYLNERYEGDLAVLWVDTHPDIMTPNQFVNAHAMVLGNLMGRGDPEFAEMVSRPIAPSNVMLAGLNSPSDWEKEQIGELGLAVAGPEDLAKDSRRVLEWLKGTGARHVAIHFDLDVLDPRAFSGLLFNDPGAPEGFWDATPQGRMSIAQVVQLINDVAEVADVVGLGITEHFPWEAIAMRDMLAKLPLLKE